MYKTSTGKNVASVDQYGLGTSQQSGPTGDFYELEPAVVLDIILDKEHPIFKLPSNLQVGIDADRWPSDFQGQKAGQGETDYSWVGRALVRLLYSNPTTQKEKLIWAYPLESNVSEYPLVNEVVMVCVYEGKYFYSKKLNLKNLPNEAVDFGVNQAVSNLPNNELYGDGPYVGRQSKTSHDATSGFTGVAGKYYKINNKVRSIKRYEGDLVVESRFGQSIRFAAYDDLRENDQGFEKFNEYKDYGGNPMILIRNRQRKILKDGETLKLTKSPNEATIFGTKEEKNAGGYVKEDINHDGTSIHITTGQTISKWVTTCYKKMFGVTEEVGAFSGTTNFKYPILSGDQLVLNTDRIILSSRYGETFHYSKKRYGIVTDDEYTLDAHNQVVITTHTKTVINSPAIYLGQYDETNEPALLGQTTVNWLYDLCNWLLEHTHWYIHSHIDAGKESPSQTQIPVQVQKLIALRDQLHLLMSRRVFVTGGGLAPGQNGASITDGSSPVNISIPGGGGVPGGWKGANRR